MHRYFIMVASHFKRGGKMKEFNKIKLDNDFRISIIQYDSLYANSFRDFDTWNWSDWLNKLQIPMINENKYKRGLVLYGDVEDSNGYEKYRKDDNIINRSVIALDYDVITDFKRLDDAIHKQLEGYSWAYHTTHSHHTEKPRIRLMVPLNEPVSADDYRKYSNALANHIGYEVDEASFVPSQVMALPVKKDKSAVYMFKHNDAPAVTIEQLGLFVTSGSLDSNVKPNFNKGNIVNFPKRDSSHWREIAFGVGKGGRNNALPSIIGHLLRKGVDLNLVYGYAYLWGKACTPPLSDDRINRTVISIFKKHKSH